MNSALTRISYYQSRNTILADKISKLAAHIHAATYRFLVMIREFDERQAWAEMGSRSCAHWLNWRCGISVHTAREKIRVAHALVNLEKISRAFELGQLSYSKVRALTRAADKETEDIYLNIALSGTAAQIERMVRCDERFKSEEELVLDYKAANKTREFSWFEERDGTVVFQGRLPAEQASRVISAIESAEQEIAAEKPAEEESSQELPKTSAAQRRADALVHLVDRSCNGYQVMLHVPAETLEQETPSEQTKSMATKTAHLDKGGPISMEAARRICCDAGITPVVEGKYGEVLDIGRKTRKIPPAIRRALEVRDKKTCRFPGCTHTRYLHGHHIKHWSDGGVTALNNLVLLCSHHHGLVHEGGFSCRAYQRSKNTSVNIVFKRPDGVVLPDAFALRPTNASLEDTQATLDIDKNTCIARDAGTTLDVNWVLDALLFVRDRKKKKKKG